MNFITNCIKGIFIGTGAILPGISSGVLCVIFGIYEKLLDSVLHFFQDIKNNFKFLFPIAIGGILGIILGGKFLNYFLVTFPIQTKSIFVGLILGSIPSLFREVNEKQKYKSHNWIYFVLALGIGILTVVLEQTLPITNLQTLTFPYLVLCGFVMSIGIIVPGVSSTILLMLLGIYTTYLTAVSSVYLPILIPIVLGVVLGSILWMKMTRFLLDHFYAQTFYSIIGFTVGSIFVLLPSFSFDLNGMLSLLCILFGFLMMQRSDLN